MKIFLLEDDASIAMGLEYSLHKDCYCCGNNRWRKTVSHIILNYKHRSYSALLRTHNRA